MLPCIFRFIIIFSPSLLFFFSLSPFYPLSSSLSLFSLLICISFHFYLFSSLSLFKSLSVFIFISLHLSLYSQKLFLINENSLGTSLAKLALHMPVSSPTVSFASSSSSGMFAGIQVQFPVPHSQTFFQALEGGPIPHHRKLTGQEHERHFTTMRVAIYHESSRNTTEVGMCKLV